MIFRTILRDVFFGFRDSLKGFLAVHKLDRKSGEDSDKLTKSTKKNDDRTRPLSVLEARRIERAKAQDRFSPSHRTTRVIDYKSKAWKKVFQCVALNVLCICTLQLVILPLIRSVAWLSLSLSLSLFSSPHSHQCDHWRACRLVVNSLGALSILPVFLVSRVVNALWFADIAKAALKLRDGTQESVGVTSFSRSVADFLLAVLLETAFLIQSLLAAFIPVPFLAPFLSFVHLSLLYSLYSFEYSWMAGGLELKSRVRRIESFWPYYLGFGAPLVMLTTLSSNFIVNGCLFGMAFPFFIISTYRVPPDVPPFGTGEFSSIQVPSFPVFASSLALTSKLSKYLAYRVQKAR